MKTIKNLLNLKSLEIITLLLYLVLLLKYLLIEEIIGFFILPILITITISSVIFLIIRIFKRKSYKSFLKRSLYYAFVLQVIILGLILWAASPRYFNDTQVIKDIDYSIKVMEEVHPNLYFHIDKDSFNVKLNNIKNQIPEKLSDADVLKTFGKSFALFKDGHTGIGMNNFIKRGSFAFRKTLPYKFEINNDRVFLIKNYTHRNKIPVGSEIIKINDKPIDRCLEEISAYLSYENIPYRNAILQIPIFWNLWNNYHSYKLSYIEPQQKELKEIKTTGGFISNVLSIIDLTKPGNEYSFEVMNNDIGYIEFNAFNDLSRFKSFLESTFTTIKTEKINHLIIDIRKNGGGNSKLGDELLQYISHQDFKYWDTVIVKISNELIEKKMLNWIDSTERKPGKLFINKDKNSPKQKLRDNELRFSGECYLLIGSQTFSSASDLASVFQCYNIGKTIGTETGGITASYGDFYLFNLPNTNFDARVSWKYFVNTCGNENGTGVIPDFIVETAIEDYKNGNDRVLDFTIDYIENKK